jgi:hypothetical protein
MNQKQIGSIVDLIFEHLEPDYDESGYFVETGKAQDELLIEYPELTLEQIESILEIVRDWVEISHSRVKEEEGFVDYFEYNLDSKAEERIKEILNK